MFDQLRGFARSGDGSLEPGGEVILDDVGGGGEASGIGPLAS
jgi:hypothetical protein